MRSSSSATWSASIASALFRHTTGCGSMYTVACAPRQAAGQAPRNSRRNGGALLSLRPSRLLRKLEFGVASLPDRQHATTHGDVVCASIGVPCSKAFWTSRRPARTAIMVCSCPGVCHPRNFVDDRASATLPRGSSPWRPALTGTHCLSRRMTTCVSE